MSLPNPRTRSSNAARALLAAIGLTALLAMTGCHRPEAESAQIRLIDAIPNADRLQVGVPGKIDWKRAVFREGSPYERLPAGTYRAVVTAQGKGRAPVTLPMDPLRVASRRRYTAIATGVLGGSPAAALSVFEETPSQYPLPNDKALVRVVNAASDAGRVDLVLNNIVAFKDLPFGRPSFLMALPAMRYECKAKEAGDLLVLLTGTSAIDLRGGKSYLLVVLGRASNGGMTVGVYPE